MPAHDIVLPPATSHERTSDIVDTVMSRTFSGEKSRCRRHATARRRIRGVICDGVQRKGGAFMQVRSAQVINNPQSVYASARFRSVPPARLFFRFRSYQ